MPFGEDGSMKPHRSVLSMMVRWVSVSIAQRLITFCC